MGERSNPLDLRRKSVKSETKSETQGFPLFVRHLVPRKLSQVRVLLPAPKMTDNEFAGKVSKLFNEMAGLLIKKREDYGDNFEKSVDQFGLISPLIRMQDKLNRLTNLVKSGGMAKNESIEDSFRDLIGYAALSLLYMNDEEDA